MWCKNRPNNSLLNFYKFEHPIYPPPVGRFSDSIELNSSINMSLLEPVQNSPRKKSLGGGGYSKVFLFRHRLTNVLYAVKRINKMYYKRESEAISLMRNEINIQSRITHPNIVKLFNVEENRNGCDLILEYASNGNLFSIIRKNRGLSEDSAFYFFIQTLNAINFLHQNSIIHRDIKPENLLLNSMNQIKLCDFGCSTLLKSNFRSTICGTTEYMAPEVIGKCKYDYSIDVWSLGVLLYELIHSYSPFATKKEINPKIIEQNIINNDISFNCNISFECKDLIRKLLIKDSSHRMKLEDIYYHPFILKYVNIISKNIPNFREKGPTDSYHLKKSTKSYPRNKYKTSTYAVQSHKLRLIEDNVDKHSNICVCDSPHNGANDPIKMTPCIHHKKKLNNSNCERFVVNVPIGISSTNTLSTQENSLNENNEVIKKIKAGSHTSRRNLIISHLRDKPLDKTITNDAYFSSSHEELPKNRIPLTTTNLYLMRHNLKNTGRAPLNLYYQNPKNNIEFQNYNSNNTIVSNNYYQNENILRKRYGFIKQNKSLNKRDFPQNNNCSHLHLNHPKLAEKSNYENSCYNEYNKVNNSICPNQCNHNHNHNHNNHNHNYNHLPLTKKKSFLAEATMNSNFVAFDKENICVNDSNNYNRKGPKIKRTITEMDVSRNFDKKPKRIFTFKRI